MPFYAFRLDNINVKFQRGKIPDNDLVTFGVFVNQVDRGHGAATFDDLVSGADTPAVAVPPNTGWASARRWIISPMEIDAGQRCHHHLFRNEYQRLGAGAYLVTAGRGRTQDSYDVITTTVIGEIGLGAVAAAVGSVSPGFRR